MTADTVTGSGPGEESRDGDRSDTVLTVDHLNVVYRVDPPVHAVRDVSLALRRGEILGLAGESGCGKTTLAYAINRLHEHPAEITSGHVTFHDSFGTDIDLLDIEGNGLREFRWDKLSMVFQGAMNALNPVTSVRAQLDDVLTTHRPGMTKKERLHRCWEVLDLVRVERRRLDSYPHELSGGMRQRVMIAMALLLSPQVVLMDEPTTALDVVVQRGILQEVVKLRDELGCAIVFITHDLPLLLELSDRIAIMLRGQIVEYDTAEKIYGAPEHPYTQQLLSSFPSLTGERGGFVRDSREDGTHTSDPEDDR